jgi:FHS family L-fucose permease-like MFS transporter
MQTNTADVAEDLPDIDQGSLPNLRAFTYLLFFVFGGITSLNDVLIPKLKELFDLSYGQAMLVQSAFFGAYLLISIPASMIVRSMGYLRVAFVGITLMMAGSLLFVPASTMGSYYAFLFALFVLAAGITTVQVVANPLISILGPVKFAHSRLTFAQAFNSFGTTIFPYAGSMLILGALVAVDQRTLSQSALAAYRSQESHVVAQAYIGLAIALAFVAAAVWSRRNKLPRQSFESLDLRGAFRLLKHKRFSFGVSSIFLYVGAEVAVGSLIVSYLMQSDGMALTQRAAGVHVSYYWGGAMVGRFIGAMILKHVSPGKVLASSAATAIALLFISMSLSGAISGWALLAIGLCNSVMFPTIFNLASEGLGTQRAEGSGILCMAIVGGAVIPPLTGHLADLIGLHGALLLPAICYSIIASFGFYTRRE